MSHKHSFTDIAEKEFGRFFRNSNMRIDDPITGYHAGEWLLSINVIYDLTVNWCGVIDFNDETSKDEFLIEIRRVLLDALEYDHLNSLR